MARVYVADLPGGTATTTIQIQQTQTLKRCLLSILMAAAGKVELSTSPTAQIGTAQPDVSVLARVNCSAGTAAIASSIVEIPINLPVKAFQNIYVHQTGAGNLGDVVFS